MPIYDIPPLASWDDFQSLCVDIWKKIWDNPNVESYGTQGQKQNGVDIILFIDGEVRAIQCKQTTKKLTESIVSNEIDKAKKFPEKLSEYVIATTAKKDARLQDFILNINKENHENGIFTTIIYFWEDILEELNSHPEIMKKYYPTFFSDDIDRFADRFLENSLEFIYQHDFNTAIGIINELEIFFSDFSNKIKYKFLISKGQCLQLCSKNEEAGKLFVEAYQYNINNEKALFFKSLGLFYNDQIEETKSCIEEIKKLNPLNEEIYILLPYLWYDKGWKYILSNIPEKIQNLPYVSYELSKIALHYKENKDAEKFLKNSHDNGEYNLDVNADFAIFELNKLIKDQNNVERFFLKQKSLKKFEEIEKILKSSLDKILENNECLFDKRMHWFVNLISIELMLDKVNSAKYYINEGLKLSPKNLALLLKKAEVLYLINERDESEKIVKKIVKKDSRSINLFKRISFEKNEYSEVIETSKELLKKFNNNSEAILNIKKMMVEAYIMDKNQQKACEKLKEIKKDLNPSKYELYAANICKITNEDLFYERLLNAAELIDEKSQLSDNLYIADNCVEIEEYNIAIRIFENNLNIKKYSNFVYKLGFCYYKTRKFDETIKICEFFKNKNIIEKDLLNLQIDSYFKISDYENAKNIIEIYLNNFGEDFNYSIRLAQVNFFTGKLIESEKFLDECPDFKQISIDDSIIYYELNKFRNLDKNKLLDILFEIRQSHFNEPRIHDFYVYSILKDEYKLDYSPIELDFEMGFLIKSPKNTEEWKFLTKKQIKDIYSEVNEENELVEFKGKSIGYKAKFNESIFELVGIRNKYIFAFHQSNEIIEMQKTKSVHPMQIGNIKDFVDKLMKIQDDKHKHSEKVKDFYKQNNIPIALVSKGINRDIIDSYIYIMGEVGIKIGENGLIEDYDDKLLVLDVISLLTIHYLNIQDKILEAFDTITIAYSTLFEFKMILDSLNPDSKREMMLVTKVDGKPVRQDVNYNEKIELVKNIIKWVEDNCKLSPLKNLSNLNNNQEKMIKSLDCNYVTDNIIIATEKESLFYSDDMAIRNISKNHFNVESVCTKDIIDLCLSKNIITADEYQDLINKMFISNFEISSIALVDILGPIFKNDDLSVFFKFLQKISNYNWRYPHKYFSSLILKIEKSDQSNLNKYILINLLLCSILYMDNGIYIIGNIISEMQIK